MEGIGKSDSGYRGREINQANFLFFIQNLRKIIGLKNNGLEGDSKGRWTGRTLKLYTEESSFLFYYVVLSVPFTWQGIEPSAWSTTIELYVQPM